MLEAKWAGDEARIQKQSVSAKTWALDQNVLMLLGLPELEREPEVTFTETCGCRLAGEGAISYWSDLASKMDCPDMALVHHFAKE